MHKLVPCHYFTPLSISQPHLHLQIKNEHFSHAFEVSSFLFFVGPMTLIAVLYVLIGIKLRKSKLLQGVKRASSDYTTPPRGISAQSRVIRMLGRYLTRTHTHTNSNQILHDYWVH